MATKIGNFIGACLFYLWYYTPHILIFTVPVTLYYALGMNR